MIEFKYRHDFKRLIWTSQWIPYDEEYFECIKCKLVVNYIGNITQFLPNCTISADEWIIKQIIE